MYSDWKESYLHLEDGGSKLDSEVVILKVSAISSVPPQEFKRVFFIQTTTASFHIALDLLFTIFL
jgi:hypothetical protein